MANQKIKYTGEFDVSNILSGLKQIASQLKNVSANPAIFSNVDKDFEKIDKMIIDIKSQIAQGFSDPKSINTFAKSMNSLYSSLNYVQTELKEISQSSDFKIKGVSDAEENIKKLEKDLESFSKKAKTDLETAFKGFGFSSADAKAIANQIKDAETLKNKLKEITEQRQKDLEKAKEQANINISKAQSKAGTVLLSPLKAKDISGAGRQGDQEAAASLINEAVASKMKDVLNGTVKIEDAWDEIVKKAKELGVTLNNQEAIQNKLKNAYDNMGAAIHDANKEVEDSEKKLAEMGTIGIDGSYIPSGDANTLINDFINLQERTQEAENNITNLTQRINELNSNGAVSELSDNFEETAQNIRQSREEAEEDIQKTEELTESQNRLNKSFERAKDAIKTFLSLGTAISGLRNVVQQTFNDIKELDAAFASIAMVTDYSVEQMWESYGSYAEMANRLGQSTKDVIASSALFYQQGLDTVEALELTESTMKLATLAGSDFETATSQMTAALRGFHMEMTEGERITDVYSELAAKAAADVDGIAYAMSKTASIASSAGMEFETTSAFLTQMIETTQEAPENIGTAMKTIIARFTELKENVAGTADSEFEDLDYNKVDTALKSVGVSLKDTNGQFRDLDDVFLELSQKWNTLDRNSQRYIATIAAGSRQQSRFIAMMENYDRTVELIDTAYDSAGRSSEQFAKYQDTLEYKLNQLQNTWEQFRTSFFNSDFFKGVIDGLNNLLVRITDLSSGELISLGAGVIGTIKIIVSNVIPLIQKGVNNLQKIISDGISKALNFKGVNIKKLTLSVDVRKERLKELEKEIQKIQNEKIKFISDNKQAIKDLQEIQRKIAEVKAQGQEITFGEAAENLGLDLNRTNDAEAAKKLLNESDERQKKLEDEQNLENEILGDEQKQLEEADARGQAIGTALSIAISSAMIAAATEDDPISAFGQVLITGLTGLIPTLISLATTAGVSMSTAFAATGIGALIVAGAAAITAIIVGIKGAYESIEAEKAENQVKRLEEEIENLDKEISETKSNLRDLSEENKTLENIQETYEKLGNKTVKTSEEQAEYNQMIESLKEEYPELITFYNEEAGQIQINNSLLEEKIKLQKQSVDEEQRLLNLQSAQKQINNRELTKQRAIANITDDNGIFEGSNIHIQTEAELQQLIQEADSYTKEELDYTKEVQGMNISGYWETQAISAALDKYNEDWLNFVDETGEYLDSASIIQMVGEEANLQRAMEASEITEEELSDYREAYGYTEEVISNFAGAVAEYNTDLSNVIKTLNDFDVENQALANKEIISQQLGEEYETASSVLSYKAARIQESMSKESNYNEKRKIMISELQKSGYDTSEIDTTDFDVFLKDALSGVAGSNWSRLDESSKNLAKAMGYTIDSWTEEIDKAKNDKIAEEKLQEKYEAYLESTVNQIISTNMERADEIQEAFNDLYANMGDMTINQIKVKAEQLGEKFDLTEEDVNSLINLQGLEGALENIQTTGIDGLELLSSSAIQSFSAILDASKVTDSQRKALGNAINDVLESYNLTSEQMNQLLQIDLNQGYQQIKSNSDTYINALMQTGLTLEEATNTFNSYIQNISTILGKGIYNQEQAQIFHQSLEDEIKGFKEANQSLIDAQNEMFENGIINSETYFKLMEEGFEDYVKITSNGYELISDKAEGAWTMQALAPLNELREEISIQEDLIDEAEKAKEKFSNFSKTLTADQMSKLGLTGPFQETNTLNFDQLVSAYSELKKEGKDTSEVLKYFGENAAFVETMVQQGYTSLEEYIQALKEGKIALSEMEPDVWVQGLVSISEASVQAEEKVEDLKEELGNLNEQLEEDKEALNEAEDALRQAMHGSDDFQSSLDGLVNYTEKIERLDKAIEKTKESLEDVSNIDEAKGLLNQLNDQYKDKTVTIGAENLAIDAALSNLQSTLTQNYGDYISFDAEGNPLIDFAYMQMDANDEIRKAFEEEYNLYNEYRDKKEENLDKLEEIEKEREQQRKESLEKFVSIQENVISVLKEKAQEEIDATKEKYDALEEADNDYLDALQEAIDKQRELRDQQNKYEDLATKEKKLSLLQRDTSGASQKEVLSLQNEIEDDRQNLLDSEVDNLIESMKELYEKQKEARDAEIEYMEEVTDNAQYFADWASNIMSTWQSVEDMQAWYLENDPEAQDMTVEQTEVYLDQIKQDYSDYIQYIALSATDFATDQEELNAAINEMYENTSTNVENIGTTTQEIAQAAADKAIEEATKARDDARDKLEETQKKISETTDALNKAEDDAVVKHVAAMNAMVEASQSSMEKVSGYATKQIADMLGIDLSNEDQALKFAKDYNFINQDGYVTKNFVNAVSAAGGDTSKYQVYQPGQDSYKVYVSPGNGAPSQTIKIFNDKESAEDFIKQENSKYSSSGGLKSAKNIYSPAKTGSFHGVQWGDGEKEYFNTKEQAEQALAAEKKKKNPTKNITGAKVFAQGGLVNYTGPAWVDGTPNKPEAFLSSEDTKRIGEAAKILADIPIFNSTSNAQNAVSTNIGDTSIEIHINVENISSDYDVDEMIDRVKQDIVDVSKPIGSPVILKK